jgi:peptidoglycan/xylan/chitin deacetylase (PgdA/CDA1 family)
VRAILTWHSVDPSGSPISVSLEEFRRQVAWLASGAVRVVPLEDLLARPEEPSAVALSFDDGFANFAELAAPLLAEHGFPVTLCVVTGHVGGDNRWGGRVAPGIPVLPLLDWDALGRLAGAGVAIAAHTRSHPRLTDLSPQQLEEELRQPVLELERRLGIRPEGMAYPFGAVNERVAAETARHYRWALTTSLARLNGRNQAHRLPRIDAWYLRAPRRLAGFGSAGFRRWLGLRRLGRRLRGH